MPLSSHGSPTRGRGLAESLYRAAGRVLTLDVTRLLYLDEGDLRPPSIDPAFQIRLLDPDEVRAFARDPANDLHASFAERMKYGRDLCCAALDGDRLAAYAWFALGSVEADMHRGRTPRSGVAVSFPRSMAFIYKAFTRPEYRGRHLYPAVLAQGLAELAPRGVTQLLTSAEWPNRSALAACRGLGFHDLGTIVRMAAGPFAFTTKPPSARNYEVLLGRQARVQARLPQVGVEKAASEPIELDEPLDEPLTDVIADTLTPVGACGRER